MSLETIRIFLSVDKLSARADMRDILSVLAAAAWLWSILLFARVIIRISYFSFLGEDTYGGFLTSRSISKHTAGARVIDANMLADHFAFGEIATLTITIRMPNHKVSGKWSAVTTSIDAKVGPVTIMLETVGFTVISKPPPPIEIPDDQDSPPVAFELRIEDSAQRWIHAILIQDGHPVGELLINDFSMFFSGDTRQRSNSTFRRIAEADLMLVVRAGEGRIEACSPSDRASLDHVTMLGFNYPESLFRDRLAGRLRALYDASSGAEATERELKILGVELAQCLPEQLRTILRQNDIGTVMLRHEEAFDFPLELVYLDSPTDPFFVGDRIAVCRWFLGVTNLPDVVVKRVRAVAMLKGHDDAVAGDEALLKRRYPGRISTFNSKEEIPKLFKSSKFDIIHFTGHCRRLENGEGVLELADGKFVRLAEIGQLESERAFTVAEPFVMINACASAQPYFGVTQRDSFAHRFVTSRACAVLGTMWPVEGSVANEFAEKFYENLVSKKIGHALLDAKKSLLESKSEDWDADSPSEKQLLARQVAVRGYCLFANPDLRVF